MFHALFGSTAVTQDTPWSYNSYTHSPKHIEQNKCDRLSHHREDSCPPEFHEQKLNFGWVKAWRFHYQFITAWPGLSWHFDTQSTDGEQRLGEGESLGNPLNCLFALFPFMALVHPLPTSLHPLTTALQLSKDLPWCFLTTDKGASLIAS